MHAKAAVFRFSCSSFQKYPLQVKKPIIALENDENSSARPRKLLCHFGGGRGASLPGFSLHLNVEIQPNTKNTVEKQLQTYGRCKFYGVSWGRHACALQGSFSSKRIHF
jgi:hypothetical protein